MEIEIVPLSEILPYEQNPRKNDRAVDVVVKSIKEFGFRNPIMLDKDNVIVAGHTRARAAHKLGLQEVPIIRIEGLTPAQIRAYRIMDNKSQEHSYWDYPLLKKEIFELKKLNVDLGLTGFTIDEVEFFNPDTDKSANNPYEEWRKSGALEYGNEDKTGYKTILLHFNTPEDVKEFSELVNQTITDRTRYLWYPKQPGDSVKDIQYEEETTI